MYLAIALASPKLSLRSRSLMDVSIPAPTSPLTSAFHSASLKSLFVAIVPPCKLRARKARTCDATFRAQTARFSAAPLTAPQIESFRRPRTAPRGRHLLSREVDRLASMTEHVPERTRRRYVILSEGVFGKVNS